MVAFAVLADSGDFGHETSGRRVRPKPTPPSNRGRVSERTPPRENAKSNLIDELGAPVAEPGSVVWEMYRAAIEAKIADRQLDVAERQLQASIHQVKVARQGVEWSRVQGYGVVAATVISLVALLVAAL